MRICVLSPYDLSLEGGVNKHVLHLARCLREGGDHVEVIGPASGAPPDAPHVTCLPGVVSIQGNDSDNRIAIFARPWQVASYMRRHRFDAM